ncbi:hypothetical protein [Corynebacterium propinquum]|uniref:hypothetical protein n=1 Tax=Corynebacterium propinquum TaxID=43769 RepID=UPI001AD84163|nr:hypothetical protein [Corynebacterium propinquum]
MDLRADNARLRCELVEAKMETGFLLNAIAFFALRQREKKNSNWCSHQSRTNYSITGTMACLLKVPLSGFYKQPHMQQERLSGKDLWKAFTLVLIARFMRSGKTPTKCGVPANHRRTCRTLPDCS